MKEVQKIKVYITKYCLTEGIFEIEGELVADINMIRHQAPGIITTYYSKEDWHTTYESAVKKANEMRLKKISSLQKQIDKLQKPFL